MAREALVRTPGRGVGVALAGVVFCDFVGLMLLSLGPFGWILGFAAMFAGSTYSAWMALDGHPKRRSLTVRIGIANAVVLVVIAASLFGLLVYAMSTAQWG
ncbi:MAG TPA: hypothetical protein VJ927_10770 [Actinomycetota bacterium]|nr:hypothetical protein [Actinomycetota bacterium]